MVKQTIIQLKNGKVSGPGGLYDNILKNGIEN